MALPRFSDADGFCSVWALGDLDNFEGCGVGVDNLAVAGDGSSLVLDDDASEFGIFHGAKHGLVGAGCGDDEFASEDFLGGGAYCAGDDVAEVDIWS